jgi:ADP-ribose pyrophosphatase YjhB (NUDIX family)
VSELKPTAPGAVSARATIVAGVVMFEDELIMVRQPGPAGPGTVWALPGGRVERGELITEAIVREIREETSLDTTIVRLLSVGEFANPTAYRRDPGEVPSPGQVATVFIFLLVSAPSDLTGRNDPDCEIDEVARLSLDQGREFLERHPFPFMRRLSVAAVDSVRADRMWTELITFRRTDDGSDVEIDPRS